MQDDIKSALKQAMKERKVKTPALANFLKIPKDRIYAWYRDNTNPKGEDRDKIQKWINGEISIFENSGKQIKVSVEDRLIRIEAHLEVYGNVISSLLANNNPITLSDTQAELVRAVESAVNRRLDELGQ